jgi:hypothetical protein
VFLENWDVASVLRRMSRRVVEAKAGDIDPLNLKLLLTVRVDNNPEATWGYMVKRISAHGGCLGGQRR